MGEDELIVANARRQKPNECLFIHILSSNVGQEFFVLISVLWI